MTSWAGGISAITLLVDDLAVTRRFYEDVFGLPVVHEDDDSAVFRFGGTLVNLLKAQAGGELVEPLQVGGPGQGVRAQLTVTVEDVDAVAAQLGVPLLNGPVDRPWGVRTAAFADPAGHVWELAQQL